MTADVLLSKLDRVHKRGGSRWLARCPAHADRGPSLSIRELDDGRVLLHCFAGCGVAEVLAAMGLDMAALFPEQLDVAQAPRERRPYSVRDLVVALEFEMSVALVILADVAADRAVDRVRARLASERILHFLGELQYAG